MPLPNAPTISIPEICNSFLNFVIQKISVTSVTFFLKEMLTLLTLLFPILLIGPFLQIMYHPILKNAIVHPLLKTPGLYDA